MMSLRENNNIFTPPRYHPGVVNRNGIDHNVGNNEIDGNLDNFKPIVDAGYYQSGSKKSPQQQSQPAPAPPQLVYQSPPQKSEADSGYYRSTRSREEEELNEAPQNRKKKQEWKPVTLNLEKHENEVPAYQRGHRQQEDVKQKSPEREKVKIFEHVTEHLKVETQQTPQQTIEEQKPKAHVERFKTRPTRDHVQEHTETKSKPQERKHHKTSPKQKKPRESPERFRRRTKELVEDEDKDKEDIFFTPPENPDKVISVHERKRSFEPSKPREERTDEFRRRTKSEDISRSEVHQVHSADGRKVEVLEGSSRPTVIIVSQKEDVTNIESESVPESATQVTTAIPDEDEGEEYGSGSFVSRTRSSLISKFTGQSSNSTTSPPSVRKIESDVMNMDQLRKAYLKQQDEIRRLKAEVKRRDYRISQLEAEISDLQR
uniref:Reticulocyte-binding protein 2 homolog a-like n=1 Tax=Saccoglossus kowalevskii TaxID=10224 RepID=A0ABM0MTE1_SACKO|nr:PREDICTED: reticulocyte-binding protein 2 homolog a-like [Saccoglossus kowalevskii]